MTDSSDPDSNCTAHVESASVSTSENSDRSSVRIVSERTPLLNIKQRRKESKIARYYDEQVKLLNSYHCDIDRLRGQRENEDSEEEKKGKRDVLLAKIVLVLNLFLLILKITPVILTNSLSVLSTLVESALDLASGVIIWATSAAIRHRDPYEYPVGRTKLEPLAVIIVSIITGVGNIQVIIEAVTQIVEQKVPPEIDILSISILSVAICLKIILFIFCLLNGKRSSSARVLAQDARNDVVTNVVAVVCALVGARYWSLADPIGAILVCSWAAINWFYTAAGQIPLISGKCASPEYINRIIRICVDHDERIRHLETVLVYHYGQKFLVEVHIVLDADMPLQEAHDILEPLQRKLETLDFVERAFVHPDYEFSHKPSDEHKVL